MTFCFPAQPRYDAAIPSTACRCLPMTQTDAKQPSRRNVVLETLRGSFAVFRDCRPWPWGIHKTIRERFPAMDVGQLRTAMRIHTASTPYLKALAKSESCFDLEGQPAGEVTPEQRGAGRQDPRERFKAADRRREDKEAELRQEKSSSWRRNSIRAEFAGDSGTVIGWRQSRVESIELRGLRYSVRHWGEAEAPWCSSCTAGWTHRPLSSSWSMPLARDWHVVAPDWRGYGASQWLSRPYWFADLRRPRRTAPPLFAPSSGSPGRS